MRKKTRTRRTRTHTRPRRTPATEPVSAPPFEPDPALPHIRAAQRHLAAYRGGALEWLCEWVKKEPADWRRGDPEAAGDTLLAIIYPAIRETVLELGQGRIPPVSAADVEQMHGELRRFLTALVSEPAGTKIPVPTDELTEVLVRATAKHEKPAHFAVSLGGSRRTLLYQRIKELILADGDESRLIACPQCGTPMVALHKRRFCSDGCRQAWHDAQRISGVRVKGGTA